MYNVSVALDKFHNSMVYRAAILLSFYGFFRISNLVASTLGSFDPTRQLCREDVCLLADSVKVHMKWAKNLQKSDQSHDHDIHQSF